MLVMNNAEKINVNGAIVLEQSLRSLQLLTISADHSTYSRFFRSNKDLREGQGAKTIGFFNIEI